MMKSTNDLLGYDIQAQDGSIGTVKDFLFDDRQWVTRYLVVDTNNWLPASRKVLISPVSIQIPNLEKNLLPLNLTKEQIKDSPPLEEHLPVSKQYEADFFRYYGYGYYWMGANLWGQYPYPAPLIDKAMEDDVNTDGSKRESHLRSVREVEGYYIEALDGKIGHVEDFIMNDKSWEIALLGINTCNWWPGGKSVLISPKCIKDVSWTERLVRVELSVEQIKQGVEYDEDQLTNPDKPLTKESLYVKREKGRD